jgi:hypothetical protein
MTNANLSLGINPVGGAAFVAPFVISHGPVSQILGQHMMKIPEIQRPFAWKLQNAEELVRDLMKLEAARQMGKAQPQHYLGSLVVVTVNGQKDEVVDGQQRLTTISVLIGQIIRALKDLASRADAKATQNGHNVAVVQTFRNIEQNAINKVTILRNLIQVQQGVHPQTQKPIYEPRLEVSPEIRLTFAELIEGRDGMSTVNVEPRKPASDLRQIAKFLYEDYVTGSAFKKLQEADQFRHLDARANQVADGLIWVRLGTPHADAAAELFESLNARGRPLNVLGLVKVWLLATLKQVSAQQATIDQVAADFRELSDDDDKIAVQYFYDFYRMRALEDVKTNIETKEMSLLAREKLFRDPVLTSPASGAPQPNLERVIADEVAMMKQHWPIWERLMFGDSSVAARNKSLNRLPAACMQTPNPVWVNTRLNLLLDQQWLAHKVVYPFLTAAAHSFANSGKFNEFQDFIHDIEKFFFRIKSVCNVSPAVIKQLYFKHLAIIKATGAVNLGALRLEMNQLLQAHATDVRFSQELLNSCIYGSGTDLTKYFFSMIETYAYSAPQGNGRPLVPTKSQVLIDLRDWQIEHIVPQNPQAGGHSLGLDVHRLGNLCLLPPDWNQYLTNKDFQTKRQMVALEISSKRRSVPGRDPLDVFTNPAYGSTPWTISDCTKREQVLIKRALEIFVI